MRLLISFLTIVIGTSFLLFYIHYYYDTYVLNMLFVLLFSDYSDEDIPFQEDIKWYDYK